MNHPQPVYEAALTPIKGVALFNQGSSTKRLLNVQDDITTKELSDIMVMLITMTLPQAWDYDSYIAEHNLERHFIDSDEDLPVTHAREG